MKNSLFHKFHYKNLIFLHQFNGFCFSFEQFCEFRKLLLFCFQFCQDPICAILHLFHNIRILNHNCGRLNGIIFMNCTIQIRNVVYRRISKWDEKRIKIPLVLVLRSILSEHLPSHECLVDVQCVAHSSFFFSIQFNLFGLVLSTVQPS